MYKLPACCFNLICNCPRVCVTEGRFGVGLALGGKIVQWVLPETETEATTMQCNVNTVHWVQQPQLKVLLNVMLEMLERLATSKAVLIKTAKAKQKCVKCNHGELYVNAKLQSSFDLLLTSFNFVRLRSTSFDFVRLRSTSFNLLSIFFQSSFDLLSIFFRSSFDLLSIFF